MLQNLSINKIATSRISEVDFDNIPFGKVFSDHMFIADFDGNEWKDARIVPYGPMDFSPAISALHYGQSIFEGLKAYLDQDGNPQMFRPEQNWKRMNTSADRLCMPNLPKEIFIEGIKQLVKMDKEWIPKNSINALYIRPFMFAMDDYVGIRPSDTYRFVIFTCPVGSYYTAPLNVKVSEDYVRAFPKGTGYAKVAGNYAAGMLPLKKAKEEGFDQLIWLDGQNLKYVEESGTMNLFFIIDGVLTTPITDGTILYGVTRDSVLHIAKDLGIPVEIRKISIQEVYDAYTSGKLDDAFGTGTAATIAPIMSISYKGVSMKLPPANERLISAKFKDTLFGINTSSIPDKFNWMMKI